MSHLIEEAFRVVDTAKGQGRYSDAADILQQIMLSDASNSRAPAELGKLAEAASDIALAKKMYQLATERAPFEANGWILRLRLLQRHASCRELQDAINQARAYGLKGGLVDEVDQFLHDRRRSKRKAIRSKDLDRLRALVLQQKPLDALHLSRMFQSKFLKSPSVLKIKAVALDNLARFDEALLELQEAIVLDPTDWEAHRFAAAIMLKTRKPPELALKAASNAYKLRACWETAVTFAECLIESGDVIGALTLIERADQKWPNQIDVRRTLAHIRTLQGNTHDAVEVLSSLVKDVPFNWALWTSYLFNLTQDIHSPTDYVLEQHLNFGRIVEENVPVLPRVPPTQDPETTKKIGFVSGDLCNHAVAKFLTPILEALQTDSQIEIWIYNNTGLRDTTTEYLEKLSYFWREVSHLTDLELARQIQFDKIDLLIDLSGHTAKNRLGVFALKPAVKQASWLGYPNSTGLKTIDYYIAPSGLLPHGDLISRWPEKFVTFDAPIFFSDTSGAKVNGNKEGVLLASFNRIPKISNQVIVAWLQILERSPHARLIIGNNPGGAFEERVRDFAGDLNISSDRIRFLPRLPLNEFSQVIGTADLILDAWPYSGGTTTQIATECCVPTVTLLGDSVAGAQSAYYARAYGATELIVSSPVEFVNVVTTLCNQPERLKQYRAQISTFINRACQRKRESQIAICEFIKSLAGDEK